MNVAAIMKRKRQIQAAERGVISAATRFADDTETQNQTRDRLLEAVARLRRARALLSAREPSA